MWIIIIFILHLRGYPVRMVLVSLFGQCFPHKYLLKFWQGLSPFPGRWAACLLSAMLSGLPHPEVRSCWNRMCIKCILAENVT